MRLSFLPLFSSAPWSVFARVLARCITGSAVRRDNAPGVSGRGPMHEQTRSDPFTRFDIVYEARHETRTH